MTRKATLRERLTQGVPDLVADLYLYPTEAGGKTVPAALGWGGPCMVSRNSKEAWDGYPLLAAEMLPGERRRVGFVFMSGQTAVDALRPGGRFYLNEGRFVGEAVIVG